MTDNHDDEVLKCYLWTRSQLRLPRSASKQWRIWAGDPANVASIRDLRSLHALLLTITAPSLSSAAELRAECSGEQPENKT